MPNKLEKIFLAVTPSVFGLLLVLLAFGRFAEFVPNQIKADNATAIFSNLTTVNGVLIGFISVIAAQNLIGIERGSWYYVNRKYVALFDLLGILTMSLAIFLAQLHIANIDGDVDSYYVLSIIMITLVNLMFLAYRYLAAIFPELN